MTRHPDWIEEARLRCIAAGVCREPTEAEWDEALAPLVAQLLIEQDKNALAAIMELAHRA